MQIIIVPTTEQYPYLPANKDIDIFPINGAKK